METAGISLAFADFMFCHCSHPSGLRFPACFFFFSVHISTERKKENVGGNVPAAQYDFPYGCPICESATPKQKRFIKALFPCSTEPSTIQGTYANEQTAKEPLMKMERCVHTHHPRVLSTFFLQALQADAFCTDSHKTHLSLNGNPLMHHRKYTRLVHLNRFLFKYLYFSEIIF